MRVHVPGFAIGFWRSSSRGFIREDDPFILEMIPSQRKILTASRLLVNVSFRSLLAGSGDRHRTHPWFSRINAVADTNGFVSAFPVGLVVLVVLEGDIKVRICVKVGGFGLAESTKDPDRELVVERAVAA